MSVKYQVERRPVSASGKVYRGTKPGDYVSILSHPERVLDAEGNISAAKDLSAFKTYTSGSGSSHQDLHAPSKYVPVGVPVPSLTMGTPPASNDAISHVVEQIGEPWLVHSTHYSMESAVQAAAKISAAVGAENVRIVKIMTGQTVFELN